jgi:hypothetical protein
MIIFTPNTLLKSAEVNSNFSELRANIALNVTSISNPYKFSAYRAAASGSGTIVYDTENFDTNNNYSTSTGRYTAPVSGYYQFNVNSSQTVTAAPQDPQIQLIKNGTTEVAYSHFVNMYAGASTGSANAAALVYLASGDYVYATSTRALDVGAAARNNFSGFLVSQT